MLDDLLDNIITIVLILSGILITLAITGIIIYMLQPNKNCHSEAYIQYPCEGATHYARVHRNQNIGCERTKLICNEEE